MESLRQVHYLILSPYLPQSRKLILFIFCLFAAKTLGIASIAGAINVLITCPLWVASTRLKLQINPAAAAAHQRGATPPSGSTPSSTPQKTAAKPPAKPYKGLLDALRESICFWFGLFGLV